MVGFVVERPPWLYLELLKVSHAHIFLFFVSTHQAFGHGRLPLGGKWLLEVLIFVLGVKVGLAHFGVGVHSLLRFLHLLGAEHKCIDAVHLVSRGKGLSLADDGGSAVYLRWLLHVMKHVGAAGALLFLLLLEVGLVQLLVLSAHGI